MKLNNFVILILLTLSFSAKAQTLVWQQYPLNISLPIGKERILVFNEATQLQIPDAMLKNIEYSVLEGKNYYLKATKNFKSQRVFATTQSGAQYVLDIDGSDNASNDLLVIIDEKTAKEQTEQQVAKEREKNSQATQMSINDFYILLTRYAAQQSYAPARVIEQVKVNRVKVVRRDLNLFRQSPEIRATAWAQFYSAESGLYVTTVRLENIGTQGVVIDVRDIRGDFLAATAQHGFLGAAGSATAVSAIYLISNKDFNDMAGAL